MGRVNLVVLASFVAAMALAGLRLFAPSAVPEITSSAEGLSTFGPNSMRDRRLGPARVSLPGGGGDAVKPPLVPPPPDERRKVRGGSGSGGRSAELIEGLERRRMGSGAGAGGGVAADDASGEIPGKGLAARTGAVSPPRAGAKDQPPANEAKPKPAEVDNEPKPEDDVLLSLPFKGDINPDVGSGPTTADGLVSHGGDVEFTENAQFSFPAGSNLNDNTGTISFEVQPQWAGSDPTDNALVQIREEHVWENELSVVKNLDALRFIIIDSEGVERNVNLPISDWPAGEARQITAAWDETSMVLYVNGELIGRSPLEHPVNISDATLMHIGSDFPGGSYGGANSRIRNFTVYGHALGPDQIAQR